VLDAGATGMMFSETFATGAGNAKPEKDLDYRTRF